MTKRRLLPIALALTVLLAACNHGSTVQPQNTLDPRAPIAHTLKNLWNPVFAIAVVIFFLVEGLVLYVSIRFRRRNDDDQPKQIHGNTVLEFTWTAIPALILAVVGFFTVINVGKLDAIPKGPDVMQVQVTGHQWWWEFNYPKTGITTANELHLMTGQRIDVRLTSADVIHSFWPPKLAGKLDVVPGRVNHMAIDLRGVQPGYYWGQCAEYCGLSHANMRLRIVVHSPDGYARWESNQLKAPNLSLDPNSDAGTGLALFRAKGCGGCHTINGYTAGKVGPNLTHLMSRRVFAGAIFPNNADELRAWLRNPPKMKPMMPDNGQGMPNLNLTEPEINDLIAFLQTLK